jgi:hypothetical protein
MHCSCGDKIAAKRFALGYRTCLPCGEKEARQESRRKASMCLPINKSTPTYISDLELLRQLNPKRTTS